MAQTFLSPVVEVLETDNTLTTAQVATSTGYVVLSSGWGQVNVPTPIENEVALVNVFGKPNDNNYKGWFTASNFLAYANSLYVTRMATKNQFNANAKGLTGWVKEEDEDGKPIYDEDGDQIETQVGLVINNDSEYDTLFATGSSGYGQFCARYPGKLGNSIMVTYADSKSFANWQWTDSNGVYHDWTQEFTTAPNTSSYAKARDGENDEMHLLVVDAGGRFTGVKGAILEKYSFLSKGRNSRSLDGYNNYYAEVLKAQSEYVYWMDLPEEGETVNDWDIEIARIFADEAEQAEFADSEAMVEGLVAVNLATKKKLVAVNNRTVDTDTGVATNDIVFEESELPEEYFAKAILVRETGLVGKFAEAEAIEFVADDELVGAFGSAVDGTKFASMLKPFTVQLDGGEDDFEYTEADEMLAYDLIADKDEIDIGLIALGATTQEVAKYVIENICEKRMDCVAFVSPSDGRAPILSNLTSQDRKAGITSSAIKTLNNTVQWRTESKFNVSSSYGHMDSGWKYQYDKYNDCYRWIPLNGDCAGIYARTDATNASWWSGAGYNRGGVKNVVKLSFNPTKAMRDQLYQNGINPVVTFTGEGTILYGDKTLLAKPSAFDRINVRRLFIFLEKTLAKSAKYLLFEFNDAITRSYAIGLVEPLLRSVQGARGITAWKVVCDDTNNTPEIIDANRFVMDIAIAPARSINFINMNFIAEKTGSSVFTEQG